MRSGKNPKGYTWHHHQEPGTMQLVDTNIHQKTGHTGGRALWGK
ncbi:HNH endonuclease [Bacillus sp. FSL R9-9481]